MHFATLLATVSFGIGAHAWAQAGNGEWIANDYRHSIGNTHVWEACTYRNTNNMVPVGQPCKYWLDGNGNIFYGWCRDINTHTNSGRHCVNW